MSASTIKTQFLCSICIKQVKENCDAIFCDLCGKWVHRKCNELNLKDFNVIVDTPESETWSCLKCNCEIFPFNNLDTVIDTNNENLVENHHRFADFFADMNIASTFTEEENPEEQSLIDCKYYDISEFKSLTSSQNFFSFFHLNISSIGKHFENLQNLLNSLHHHFKVIAITESRITTLHPPVNYDIEGYRSYSTPTEAQAGGTMLFISNTLNASNRQDLNDLLYKPKLLESTFAEISLQKQANIIVGSIYKHPSMDISAFNKEHVQPLLETISKEGKSVILLGDLNINLLKSDTEENVSNFLDTLGNNLILPQITLPTRITPQTKTLIDNIFSSPVKHNKISGNLITGISDHLPQFLLLDKHLTQSTSEQFARNWKNFDRVNFTLDFISTDWENLLNLTNGNPDKSFDSFINRLDCLLDVYAPTEKLTKKQIRNNKPWITQGIKKSILARDKLLKLFINCKNDTLKDQLHKSYKIYRNHVVNIIRISKQNYFTNYFQVNSKNSKKIGKG